MISHVLGKGQGFPVESKMPGAFNTVYDMLQAFVRDYRPRSSKPESGKVQEKDLMLVTFTPEELQHIRETRSKTLITALNILEGELNSGLELKRGFKVTVYSTIPESARLSFGFIYCPESMEFPPDSEDLHTGLSLNIDGEKVSYLIPGFI